MASSVFGLVASGDEQRFRVANGLDHEVVERRVPVLENDGGNRVARAQLVDVWVVGVGSRGPDHHEVAAAGASAHPYEVLVNVGTAALKHEQSAGFCDDVG